MGLSRNGPQVTKFIICSFFRSVVKLKEIQNHRKQRKVSLISSLRETLPSWAKKQSPWKSIQLHQLISDTEDYEVSLY